MRKYLVLSGFLCLVILFCVYINRSDKQNWYKTYTSNVYITYTDSAGVINNYTQILSGDSLIRKFDSTGWVGIRKEVIWYKDYNNKNIILEINNKILNQ